MQHPLAAAAAAVAVAVVVAAAAGPRPLEAAMQSMHRQLEASWGCSKQSHAVDTNKHTCTHIPAAAAAAAAAATAAAAST